MNEGEKQVIKIIRDVTTKVDIGNTNNITYLLQFATKNPLFSNSKCGQRFIDRLNAWKIGVEDSSCIFCGSPAKNHLICTDCMAGEPNIREIYDVPKELHEVSENKGASDNYNREVNMLQTQKTQIEELFRDIDDSLLQVASQNTVSSIKKLTWVTLGLTIFNTIAIFFMVLFLWKFIMSM